MLLGALLAVAGIAFLTAGADRTVLAAARVSHVWGVPRVLVGALIVGLGTSAPELIVSVLAAIRGELDIAAGNVIGSNIANVTLVLGFTAVIGPIVARIAVIRKEGLLMLAAVTALALVVADRRIDRWEGALLFAGMLVAVWALMRWSLGGGDLGEGNGDGGPAPNRFELFIGLASLAATLLGAELLIRGAIRIANELDLAASFVGLTLVAIGTSLPELATSIAAARRHETDLVIGNVMGSNLFNSLAVAGAAGLAGPGVLTGSFTAVSVLMVAAAVVAGLFVFTGRKLVRWEGALLLAVFAAFLVVAY